MGDAIRKQRIVLVRRFLKLRGHDTYATRNGILIW